MGFFMLVDVEAVSCSNAVDVLMTYLRIVQYRSSTDEEEAVYDLILAHSRWCGDCQRKISRILLEDESVL
jgi:hypothetical protein